MAHREAWCADKLSKLVNEDLRVSTLTEIKEHFSTISQDEAMQTARCLQLPLVFDCLNDSKTEQIDLACDVLSVCMSNLSLGKSTNIYGVALERSLHHPSPNVKLMALKEIHRTVLNHLSAVELSKQVSLLVALVTCMGDEELAVAKKASDCLVLIGETRDGLNQLKVPKVKQTFAETIAINEVVRFRIYEMVVNIAIYSEESLRSILDSGLMRSLISELSSSDLLLKLNVLELLSNLALCNHGLMFLEMEGVIKSVIDQLVMIDDHPLSLIILPGYLKFFGNIAHWKPIEMSSQYPIAFNILFTIVNSEDYAVLGVAYDTLAHIAKTNEGKLVLNEPPSRMREALEILGKRLLSLPTELRIRALNCIESIIRIHPDEENNRVNSLTRDWFSFLHENSIAMVMNYAQNPFGEIRIAGLSILLALAEQEWGQEIIKNHPGLVEFLLDRNIENTKEAKEIKYEVVKALSNSMLFSESLSSRFSQFVREGPFFVQAVTEVAVEGGE